MRPKAKKNTQVGVTLRLLSRLWFLLVPEGWVGRKRETQVNVEEPEGVGVESVPLFIMCRCGEIG